jgi:peptide/nickel transport system substrate-binding protein
MQNKFGLKDFVLLVVMLAVGVTVWLGMVQRDRNWNEVLAMKSKLGDLERQLSRMETSLESGIAVAPPRASGTQAAALSGATPTNPAGPDESWARPGVKIEWQPPLNYATDPRSSPNFKLGGEFTEIFEAQPAKLTPHVQTDVYGRRIVDLVVDSLGLYDPKTLKLRGLLADAWQMDPEGKWLRVKIRDNARFSDGSPVTAEDVRYSYHDFVMNMQIEAERSRSTLDTMDRVEVVSDKVVDFFFKGEPYFANLDNALTTVYVLPKSFYSKLQPSEINTGTGLLMGSGPYKLERLDVSRQWAPPEPVVLVRNEQYYGPKPPLERIRFKAINDELARLTEYKNGDAEMVTPSAPQFVASEADPEWVKANHDLNWVNMRSSHSAIIWNCGPRSGKLTPFHDRRVRLAMTHLIDREKMIRDIWKGVGTVCKGYSNPGTPGDDPNTKPWPYDMNKARALLKDAGWEDRDGNRVLEDKDGNEFVFELTSFGGGEIAERLATFVKDSCAAAGIRCNIRQMDWSVGDPVRNQRDFDAMFMAWGANAPESDPKQIFHSSSIQNQGDNFGQWNNPEADKAIDAGRQELDYEKRGILWRRFEEVMHEDQPYTWVRIAPYLRFVKGDIDNVHTYPKGLEYAEFVRSGPSSPQPVR